MSSSKHHFTSQTTNMICFGLCQVEVYSLTLLAHKDPANVELSICHLRTARGQPTNEDLKNR